ncbi:hypothetical protein BDV27DRAFT_14316 [Aspergillus caelatus]|uniref:Uncharacterized protein n=2 Tax=Aspergillus subgen. Circumdati TaxID=2720871 RepID=A0A5N7AHU5_9EURO|nr:uncharacterized protein BDV27DRAFT_14316 [Aspergillus caelatus]KAE8369325.1 hypothetical protein BDV27DRAFT_14316 [Aspergillus caelatus]KAE8415199.1 hypothetical protein BDV36DRAFT_226869 [Aspergillus pseudocaelatus]
MRRNKANMRTVCSLRPKIRWIGGRNPEAATGESGRIIPSTDECKQMSSASTRHTRGARKPHLPVEPRVPGDRHRPFNTNFLSGPTDNPQKVQLTWKSDTGDEWVHQIGCVWW